MISIPKNPITIGINSLIQNSYFEKFVDRKLPAYEVVITSQYRDPKKNEAVGGVPYSAHQYGLATDFILKQNGKKVPIEKAESVYDEFVKPYWPGFSLFGKHKNDPQGYHIHVNLTRKISQYTGIAVGVGLVGLALAYARKKRII